MVSLRRFSRCSGSVLLVTGLWLFAAAAQAVEARTPSTALAALLDGQAPSDVADLRAMQVQVQEIARQVIPATVAIRVGQAHGSGVIINSEGSVLTAAHVAGTPNQEAWITLHDGRQIRGTTMGVFRTADAGLVQITTKRTDHQDAWPYARMGNSADLSLGQWCLAMGHPGGFQDGRQPVLRVGRVLDVKPRSINTDCTLIGGDSGGPLFDMQGQVIGIHSRIGGPLTINLHVPVNSFRESWDRLAAGEAWGHLPGSRQPFIGVQGEASADVARIVRVFTDSPAARAGIEPGDVILQFGGSTVGDFDSLKNLVDQQQPGRKLTVTILRAQETLQLELTIGER